MWFKQHPWVFPIILGLIGISYIALNIGALLESKKMHERGEDHHVSGIPFLGGIHLIIAGLISPCKWLALTGLLDYSLLMFLYEMVFMGLVTRKSRNSKNSDNSDKSDNDSK